MVSAKVGGVEGGDGKPATPAPFASTDSGRKGDEGSGYLRLRFCGLGAKRLRLAGNHTGECAVRCQNTHTPTSCVSPLVHTTFYTFVRKDVLRYRSRVDFCGTRTYPH
jgi:hypothetical protein